MRARVEYVSLEVYEPFALKPEGAAGRVTARGACYWRCPPEDGEVVNLPVIVDPDGAPWGDAARYMLSRLEGVLDPSPRTQESIAGDLLDFRRWLLEQQVDYLEIPERPRRRPTYRYRHYLDQQIKAGAIVVATARRRMGSVQNFYRWMQLDGRKFPYPLWVETPYEHWASNSMGRSYWRSGVTTDLTRSFRIPKGGLINERGIEDGGRLRPLSKEEQQGVLMALKAISCTEMTLAFLLALTTGARLQTVFTLRADSFEEPARSGANVFRIKVGSGTLVDTKYGRNVVLELPAWLHERCRIYLRSPRRRTRVARGLNEKKSAGEQYLFLSRSGRPYYASRVEAEVGGLGTYPRGNAVTQFIRQQLKPKMLSLGYDFDFRFHDLRATFGMNLLLTHLSEIQADGEVGGDKIFRVLDYIRVRMGHGSIKTTEGYLKYKDGAVRRLEIQNNYERYLSSLVKDSWGWHDLEN